MSTPPVSRLPEILAASENDLLAEWSAALDRQMASRAGTLRAVAADFLSALRNGAQKGELSDISGQAWAPMRSLLEQFSRDRAIQGFSASQTATLVFSFKEPLFARLRIALAGDADALARETWTANLLLDQLGLHTVETFQQTREEIITRQQEELLELSTPVVQLWDGVLALPLIGTLDSARTGVVMQSMLEAIVNTGAEMAIIDITGVPTVDTLVAQHLLKTVAAARLMGADCIISGIRPQIAQTIIHLGVDLTNVITKATLADAFKLALQRTGMRIVRPENVRPEARKEA